MSHLTSTVQTLYAAFGRGDIDTILNHLHSDVSWEFEAPSTLSWSGVRKGPREAAGFFAGIAAEHADPMLQPETFIESGDSVAIFGRYQATVRATGIRVDVPLAHLFQFQDGKVIRYVNITNSAAFVEAGKSQAAAAR